MFKIGYDSLQHIVNICVQLYKLSQGEQDINTHTQRNNFGI